jgi:hypothetical protein
MHSASRWQYVTQFGWFFPSGLSCMHPHNHHFVLSLSVGKVTLSHMMYSPTRLQLKPLAGVLQW